jgi:4-hydroxyacetophenone monooxygenase
MLPGVRNLDDVALPPLLAALAVVTGRHDLLRPELTLDPARRLEPQGGLDDAQQELARRMCAEALADLDANGPAPTVDDVTLRRAMEFCFGEAVGERTFAMLREELALPGEDPRAPRWSVAEVAPGRTVRAIIVGAGMSGIAAAHRLGQAGVEVRLLERAADLGGTWRDNRYPGCRVDVPNHLYSYSFATGFDWAQQFSTQPVLLQYFREVAGRLGITERIEFGTDVLGARWDDAARVWQVDVRTETGERTVEAELLVSAVGQLHRPLIPDFEGRASFAGPTFHTAAWDDGVDLAGRRVAVVGAAASAVQCVPEIAKIAARVTVFQRTPNWFLPAPNYHDDLPDSVRAALREIPHLESWYRLWLFWRLSEGLMAGTVPGPANDMFRAFFTAYLQSEFATRPDLLDAVLPDYPPFSKRVVLDDGSWAGALCSPHVDLVTAGVDRIDATGIVDGAGVHHEADVIIWATGFTASQFLAPMHIVGRDGADLRARWRDDAHAYLGITVPDFPNLFCLYGPNTNLVANGSIIFFTECEVNHLVDAVRVMLEAGATAIEPRPEVLEAYIAEVDEGNAARVWGQADVPSWYRNAAGRVTQNWPGTLEEFWAITRRADPADYRLD